MKHFSFKSGHAVRVAKLKKTDWLVVLQLEFQLYITLKSFITTVSGVLSRLNQKNKFVCVAMCSLVMSLCSRDALTIH